MKIVHIITDLNAGGAERMMLRLLKRMNSPELQNSVISLSDVGLVGAQLLEAGIPVSAIGMRSGRPDPVGFVRLVGAIRKERPDIVQTWMYHGDLVGGLAARMAGVNAVAWNIRHSDLPRESTKRSTLWTVKASARLSHVVPRRIVCCAAAARSIHVALGYDDRKMVVIPNGFDIDSWGPDKDARTNIRRELGISEQAPVIGLVGRFHPQKDHLTFTRAAGRLRTMLPEVQFILCGAGMTRDNSTLSDWLNENGVYDCTHLLGFRSDTMSVMNAFDVSGSSSSHGEGFPNVVAEAMACGVPCVVTNVGDAALVVGTEGIVVPPSAPEELSRAWAMILGEGSVEQETRRQRSRLRIVNHFSIASVAHQYEDLYRGIVP